MDTPAPFRSILLAHAVRYPLWHAGDVYKLCHQAAMGSEHAVIDRERASAWLRQELAGLSGQEADTSAEPLIDPLSADGSIARVHLRPLLRLGLPSEALLEAFLRTAQEYRGDPAALSATLQQAEDLAREGTLPFHARQLSAFLDEMRHAGFPAAHHSEIYTRAYHPAYRVVLLSTLPVEWLVNE